MGGMTHREKGAALQGGMGGTSVPRDLIESGNLTIMESPVLGREDREAPFI